MCNSNQPIPVGTVVKFKIWDAEEDAQGIGVILEYKVKLGYENQYRVHFKRFPELVYLQRDPNVLVISQSDIEEVLDTGARICDVTLKPMSEGYVWEGGTHYCINDKDILIREIREQIEMDGDLFGKANVERMLVADDIIQEYFDVCEENKIEFYYTEWELDEAVRNGDGWFMLEEDDEQCIFEVFDYELLMKAFEEADEADPMNYDDMLTSERMEAISDTEGAEDIECEECGNINTHDTEEFGFCVMCLESIV